LKRRSFIKKGFWGTALFGIEPCLSLANPKPQSAKNSSEENSFLFLDEKDTLFFRAITPVILGRVSDKDQWPPESVVSDVIKGVDTAILNLPKSTQEDLSTVFNLLAFRPTRFVMTGVWSSWEAATYDSLNDAMDSWSGTGIQLWRSAYEGIRKLILASWYATPNSWQGIGYPGPPKI